mgnify:CR=1 FL=1
MYMSNSELLDQGGFGCIYHPGITCKGNKSKRKNIVTKLQRKSFNSKNEIKIGKMIKSIADYERFFIPVISFCNVYLRHINNQLASQCKIIKENQKQYVLMKLPYVKNEPILEYLSGLGEKDVIKIIVNTADYLLEGISKLLDIGIVHFDLKGDNIIFDTKTEKPLIIDFGISIPIERPRFQNNVSQYFYVYAPEYYVWPLEVHIACFLFHGKDAKSTITESESHRIANDCVSNNKLLEELSKEKREKYISDCKKVAETYVGLSASELLEKVKASYKTWDNYAISILFLKLILYTCCDSDKKKINMSKDSYAAIKHKSNTHILNLLEKLFLTNIEVEPSKRLSLQETRKQMNIIKHLLEGHNNNNNKINIKKLAKMNEHTIGLNTFIPRKN